MTCFMISLFSVLSIFPSVCFAQTAVTIIGSTSVSMASSIFYLNSSSPSIWYNNEFINMSRTYDDNSMVRVSLLSRRKSVGFVCGFYCIDPCNSYLFSIVAEGGGSNLVWSANRDYRLQENATLQLTGDGDLVLLDFDGTKVWSTNTSGKSVQGMNLTESGNLVLFDERGAIVWQSFDHPTDTLLTGQRLYEGQKLNAGSSRSNWSSGLYYATLMPIIGFAAFTEVSHGQSQMYYQLVPNKSLKGSEKPNYAEFTFRGLLVNLGRFQTLSGPKVLQFPFDSIIYMKLDIDGHVRIYQHMDSNGMRVIVDLVEQDLGECQYPRRCGNYGLCRDKQCSCPESLDGDQYFRPIQYQLPDQGCHRITPLSCYPSLDEHRLIEVRNATYFNVIDLDAAIPKIKDLEACRKACLENCSCLGAFFKYEKNATDGYCYMPSDILSMRDGKIPNYNFTSATFIKVQIPYVAPSPAQDILLPSPPSGNKINLVAIIAGSSCAVVIIICLANRLLGTLQKRNKRDVLDNYKQVPGMPKRFSYEDLRIATENFKEKLGSGGFGSVFKGELGDGTRIAVKRLDEMGQGMREFLAEVETIGSIHHFNLVRLIGFCAEKSCRLLVYEYMCNGSLDNWIFCNDQKPCLDWQMRKKIILDIAKGLAYLHEECRQRIAHLDIKPQNILLDENFNAKVSDFGLSRLMDRGESQVQTNMRGTPGYLAPEWCQLRITVKVDVYSFGIVLLEVVCGRRNLDRSRSESDNHLLGLLQKKVEENQLIDIVENLDEELQSHKEEILRMIRIGAWCLQDDHARRPLMSTVVKVLDGVMEVDPNIIYKFSHAMPTPPVSNDHALTVPQASVLSAPR